MGHGVVALDVDGDAGRTSLAQLERQHGALPPGPRQTTGSGGQHILFRTDSVFANRVRMLPGLDVRSLNGQIVSAPSLHTSGRRYDWTDWELEIPPLPAWLEEIFKGDVGEIPWDAASWLATQAPVSIQGEGGSVVLMSIMAQLIRSMPLRSYSDVEPIIKPWNERCEPPWSDAELERAYNNALRRFQENDDGKVQLPLNSKGKPICGDNELRDILTKDPVFRGRVSVDVRRMSVMVGNAEAGKVERTKLSMDVVKRYRLDKDPGKERFNDVLDVVAADYEEDPVLTYLEGLKWDGAPYAEMLLPCVLDIPRPTPIERAMLRRWLIGCVARVYEPGCVDGHRDPLNLGHRGAFLDGGQLLG